MKKNAYRVVLLTAAVGCQNALSSPGVCPDVRQIQNKKLSIAYQRLPTRFITWTYSNYDTPNQWTFMLYFIRANNKRDALNQANELLPGITGSPWPIKNPLGQWVCTYQSSDPYVQAEAWEESAFILNKIGV